jgi:uncharacterized protein YgbK (DUF1537 family)
VINGYCVKNTTLQLKQLFKMPGVAPVEVNVEKLPANRDKLMAMIVRKCRQIQAASNTPVILINRPGMEFSVQATRLAFGDIVSAILMDLVHYLPKSLVLQISKGGVTSNEVLGSGLVLRTAR